jgi:hypothetical protein
MLALVAVVVLSVNPFLEEGRASYSALKWDKAEQQLRLACESPSNTAEERYEAHDLLARTLSATGRAEAALEAYARLLSLDPHAKGPTEAAPKIRELFRRAKESLYPRDYVRLRQLPSTPSQLELELVDPWAQVATLALFEAAQGDERFSERTMLKREFRATAELRALGPGQTLRYFVVARSESGQPLAQLGAIDKPLARETPAALSSATLPAPSPALAQSPQPQPESQALPKPRWVAWALTGLGASAAVAGGILGSNALAERQRAQDARWGSETLAASNLAQQDAKAANVLFAGAALAGTTAGVLFWVWW